jgi:hypothetical protein
MALATARIPVLLRSCVMSWDSRFPEPIELPDGVRLASLREAIVHLVNTVPSFERGIPVVLTNGPTVCLCRFDDYPWPCDHICHDHDNPTC